MPPSSTGKRQMRSGLPLAVTIGEPAGIGPDIILTAWAARKERKLPPFLVIGDPAMLARRAHALDLPVSTSALQRGETLPPFSNALPVLAVDGTMTGNPGKPDRSDSPHVIDAIRIAADMAIQGEVGGVVTAPISKSVLYEAGFSHPGHTEFLADIATKPGATPLRPVMMIASPMLRTIPVTIHVPLRAVPGLLSRELIFETASIASRELQRRFAIAKPRLAVAGLNPHAGEDGAMGREDVEIIAPAIHDLQEAGIDARGPYPADTLFHASARETYDVAICMYHDQALIPAKTLAFEDGVNVTLGLPFIRTSPDHGTAFDIAGSGKADPASFRAALLLAAQMASVDAYGKTGK